MLIAVTEATNECGFALRTSLNLCFEGMLASSTDDLTLLGARLSCKPGYFHSTLNNIGPVC